MQHASPFSFYVFVVNSEPTINVASRYEAGDIPYSLQRCADVTFLLSIGDVQDELPVGYDNVNDKLRLLVADVVTD